MGYAPALVIIDRRDAGQIDTPTMMQALLDLDYTDGHVPEVNGVVTDAHERGSWDDIEYAFQQNKLTFEEYSQLFEAHRAVHDEAMQGIVGVVEQVAAEMADAQDVDSGGI